MFDQSFVAKTLTYLNMSILLVGMVAGLIPTEAYAQISVVQPGPGLYWAGVMLTTALCVAVSRVTFRHRLVRLITNHGWRFFVSAIIAQFSLLIGIAARPDSMEIGGNMLLPFWGSVALITVYIWVSWILCAEGYLRGLACSAAENINGFLNSVRHTLIEIAHDLDEKTERIQYSVTKCFTDLQGVITYLVRTHGRNIAILSAVTTAIMIAASPVLFPGEAALRTFIFWITTTLVSATTVATWIIYTEMYPEDSEVTDPSPATAVAAEIVHTDSVEASELGLEDEETELSETIKTRAVA